MAPLTEHRIERLRAGSAVASSHGLDAVSRLLATVAHHANALPDAVVRDATTVAALLVDGQATLKAAI